MAVFGAGVAGLTAAHELADRGFSVTVYERKALGGKARSIPVPNSGAVPLPGEHGFYRNVTDTMRRIPFPGNVNGVWDNLTRATSYLHSGLNRADLTIPLPFPIPTLPNPITPKAFIDSIAAVFQTLFRLPPLEAVYAAQKLAVYVTSCTERKLGQWDHMTWEDYIGAAHKSAEYNRYLADGIIRNLATSKSRDASAHSIGLVGEASVWSISRRGRYSATSSWIAAASSRSAYTGTSVPACVWSGSSCATAAVFSVRRSVATTVRPRLSRISVQRLPI